jgi:hypothetical protein
MVMELTRDSHIQDSRGEEDTEEGPGLDLLLVVNHTSHAIFHLGQEQRDIPRSRH